MGPRIWLVCLYSILSLAFAQPTLLPQPTLNEKIDIGDYSLRLACYGEGTPSIIIEAGFGIAVLSYATWASVIKEIVKITQVCAYDRLGLGLSDPIQVERRTSQDSVDDLHDLLATANIEAPYILVGHSWGGINIRMYEQQHPEDIVGMVLVDAAHPQQPEAFTEGIPPESPDDSEAMRIAKRMILSQLSLDNPEKLDFLASYEQAQSLDDLSDLPLAVVTQSPISSPPPDIPLELAEIQTQIWQDLQADLATLSTNSTHIIATQAGHFIYKDEPQLVIDAISYVFSEATK